jgi:tetratricopeptide (TPR) repeat protein
MAGKIAGKKFGIGGCTFGHGILSFVTLSLFSLCMLTLMGCNEQTNVAVDRGPSIPPDARKAEALRELDRKFENPQAHFDMGQVYQAEGLTQKAEYHYNVALSFDPAHVQAQAAMVKLFLNSVNPAKGKTYADVYINRVSSSPSQSVKLAKAFQAEQLDEYAVATYQQALRIAPDSAIVSRELGFYYLARNDNDRAKEYFVRSFQFDPSQPDVANELGRLGVEVRIPRSPEVEEGTTVQSDQDDDREWRIVAKHGLIQVEPIVQKGEKKNE